MNRQAFFAAIRPAFGGSLSAAQVAGMNALLDAGAGLPLHHMANALAQTRRETGAHMFPIKETVMPGHKDKLPSDTTVIARLNKAWAAGKLPWVKEPYWRDGWFGRGQIQVTHRRNYQIVGRAIGVDLLASPNLLLQPEISARATIAGMKLGLFTGKKLADFDFPAALDAPPASNPRRIVNGKDGSDAEVAKHHRQFAGALVAAAWGSPEKAAAPAPPAPSAPQPTPSKGLWAAILSALRALFKKGT
jgi:hypothetical protein